MWRLYKISLAELEAVFGSVPLIGFDKNEIVEVAEKIGTYETSILPYEDCCTIFVAKHPVTKPVLEIIERSEAKLKGVVEELVEEAVRTVEVVRV